jgi:hypothetical protein
LFARHPFTVILRCERKRASKDERPRRWGRRPSRLADFVDEHLRMTEMVLAVRGDGNGETEER